VEILGNTRSTNITNPGSTWKGVNTMKYHVSISSTKALIMGHNSGTYEGEINVSKLTVKQRKFLAEKTSEKDGDICISDDRLLNSSGDLTPESIQVAMDEIQKNINETFNRYANEAIEKIKKCEKDTGYYPGTLFYDYRCSDKVLSKKQRTIKNNLMRKAKALKEKHVAEKQAKIDKFTTDILPLIEEYENGGERPEWDEPFIGSDKLKNRIYTEDRKRKTQQEHIYLTEIVNKYGTDLQKRKWSNGMMRDEEVIHLTWINTFTKGNPLPTNVWKSEDNVWKSENEEDLKHREGEIDKISDDEFKVYEEIITMYPAFSAQLMREIAYYDEEYIFECNFVRLSKKIGEYEIEADFLLD
jgi:hypothetical protein